MYEIENRLMQNGIIKQLSIDISVDNEFFIITNPQNNGLFEIYNSPNMSAALTSVLGEDVDKFKNQMSSLGNNEMENKE